MPKVHINQLAGEDEPAPIGHNRPPSPVDLLKEQLAEVYGVELAKADPLAKRANDAPATIASDDDLSIWASIGADASKLAKELDAARLNEKRPVVAAVDGYFENATARAKRISEAAIAKATDYNKRKAAQARIAQEAEAKRLRDEAEAQRAAAEFAIDEVEAAKATDAAVAIETRIEAAPQQSTADLTRVRTDDGVVATTRTDWKFEIADHSKIDLNAIRAFIDPKAIDVAVGKIVKIQKGATKIEGVRVFEKETASFRG